MDENLLRFLMAALLVSLVITIAAISGELSSYSIQDPFESRYPVLEFPNVTALMDAMPLDRYVSLTGTASRVLEDFESESGKTYQQFYLSDGRSEIKVFCSTGSGRAVVHEGEEVFLSGRLQKYYNELEIFSSCSGVDPLP